MPAQSAPVDAEQSVFLSYCHEDDEWRDRFISHLAEHAPGLGVFNDRIGDDTHRLLSSSTRSALESAKVMFVFLSTGYLTSSWITTLENSEYVEELSRQGLRIYPVLLHECKWQTLEPLRKREPFAIKGEPIANASPDLVESLFSELTALVLSEVKVASVKKTDSKIDDDQDQPGELPVSELSPFKVSDEVDAAMDRAYRLALRSRHTDHKVTTSCLLFGIAEGGRVQVGYKTPQFLFRQLMSGGEYVYKREFVETFPTMRYPGDGGELDFRSVKGAPTRMTITVLEVFKLAQKISLATRHSPGIPASQVGQIGARHLLAALLVFKKEGGPHGALKRLSRVVGEFAELRKDFFVFIRKSLPDDDHEAWKSILIDLKPVVEPTSVPHRFVADDHDGVDLPKQPGVAGFMTDYWDGRDLLGITRDVNALASLVAAYKIEPPLAIGLFGEWGSGKSHFMRQMKKRVEKLSLRARNSPLPQKDVSYYKNIVQIEFNAWHYIEGNLWASLVDHIFANLRLFEKEEISIVEARRDEMMESLEVQKEMEAKLRQKIDERKSKLAVKATEARTEANKVQNKLDGVSQQLDVFKEALKNNVSELPVSISLSKPEEDLLRQIGVDPTSLNSVRDLQRQYQNVVSSWSRAVAQWKLFWEDPRVGRKWVLAALLVLIPLAGTYVWRNFPTTSLPAGVLSAFTFLATLYAAAKPTWVQFQKALRAMEKREQDIERDRQQKERRVLELQNELILLTREYADAKREADGISEQIRNVETAIKNTTASSILAQFIEDRASATDYRKHLGLLAIIRRDFEKIQKLFVEQRKEEKSGIEKKDIKKINRIVLYIDDLDRCPPDRVVQVLQAIHLLLAFPLFVVVVGVDSRWVTRSLQQSYEWLRDQDDGEEEQGKNGHKPKVTVKDNNGHSDDGATPHDYLEKIFQIPFWLKPMNTTAAKVFIESLTQEPEEKDSEKKNQAEQETMPPQLDVVKADSKQESKDTADSAVNVGKPSAAQPTEPGASSSEKTTEAKSADMNASKQQTEKPKETEKKAVEPEDDNEVIDLAPTSLKFDEFEIKYMTQLAPLIGRSPRAVKRFLNCYRLIKVRLNKPELRVFVGKKGESTKYKAAMLLLGVITGAPKVSSYVLEVLDDWPKTRPTTLESLLRAFSAIPEMQRQPDGERLTKFLKEQLAKEDESALIKEIVECTKRVSRFSFRVVGSETLGQRNGVPPRRKAKSRTTAVSRTAKS